MFPNSFSYIALSSSLVMQSSSNKMPCSMALSSCSRCICTNIRYSFFLIFPFFLPTC